MKVNFKNLLIILFCIIGIIFSWFLGSSLMKKNNIIKKPIISNPVRTNSKRLNAQESYEIIRKYMIDEDYDKAMNLSINLLNQNANDKISFGENSFKVAPAVLDILGEIYTAKKDYSNAMRCYQEMIDSYKNEEFHNYKDGEGSWYGLSGASGLIGQIKILTKYQPDYEKAKTLIYKLINEYKGKRPILWEWVAYYEDIASNYLSECLQQKNAPLNEWEEEYRKIINETNNKDLSAHLLLNLARKFSEGGSEEKTALLYHEVINKYAMDYSGNVEDDYVFYGLEAYKGLIEFYKNKGIEQQFNNSKIEMKSLYEKITAFLKENQKYDPFMEPFFKEYEKVFE